MNVIKNGVKNSSVKNEKMCKQFKKNKLQNIIIPKYMYTKCFASFTRIFYTKIFLILETCFSFLIHCWPIRALDVSHFKIAKNIEKV